jgi:Tfp pilus assembly protein PilO
MSSNDRTILLVIPLVAALVAFWFLVLSPKQDEVKKLDQQITTLQSSVEQQKQAAQAGLEARKHFPRDYQKLVVMGKAVPIDDQTASLLVQINKIAADSGVSFRAISLSTGGSSTATASTAAPATESAASMLPIGATVGAAGLPILPYELTFRGDFFQVADFMAGVDRLVKTRKGEVAADGRLVTIDGFTLASDDVRPFPTVKATLNVTTYVTPSGQGLTPGATPAGPTATPAAAAQTAETATATPTSASATPTP